MTDRTRARGLALESNSKGDAVGWFERLYAEAAAGTAVVPWADRVPNPHVVEWLIRAKPPVGRALDIGSGLGDTAEELARHGHRVTAFDISATAVAEARSRFPASSVDYRVGDMLDPSAFLDDEFDLVVECYTLQVLPASVRPRAVACLRATVAPGGVLLVVARGREPGDPAGEMPWPLTQAEIESIASDDLYLESFEDFLDDETPPVRRFRASFRRVR